MHYDEHGTAYSFDSITGGQLDGCAFLAFRREPESRLTPWEMESWIVLPSDSFALTGERLIALELGVHGFLTGAWYAPSGVVYATEFDGRLYMRDPSGRGWRASDFGADVQLHGVWGLDDRQVYVWGRNAWGPCLWRLAENQFEAMPTPPGFITTLRGTAPENLYAAGRRGLLARWDGGRWLRIRLRLLRDVTGMSVDGVDDLWVTTDNGKLFEGTRHGWALRAHFDGPLFDVARWRGELWVAAGNRGVFTLEGRTNALVPRAPDVPAVALSSGAELLVLGEDALAVSRDGSEFRSTSRHVLRSHCQDKRPRWRAVGAGADQRGAT